MISNAERSIACWIGLFFGVAFAQEIEPTRIHSIHSNFVPIGTGTQNSLLIGHHFMISQDPDTKVASWCCYRATESGFASRNSITRNWLEALPDQTLEENDFRGPEYDIGHLAPLGSFKASPYAFELNFLANCAPQTPALNRGPWLRLEKRIRDLTEDHPYVDVCVGPLYEKPMPPLPNADETHVVPSHYWAIVTPRGKPPECYVVDQACGRDDDLNGFAVALDEVVQRTGLSFKPSG